MGNTPKRAKTPASRITPEIIAAAKELTIAPGTSLTASELFLLQRVAELDERRQKQIDNQKEVINRLIALVEGVNYEPRSDDDPMPPVVYRLGNDDFSIRVRSAEVVDDKIVITFEEE